jgi:hypothetical protein
MPRPSPFTPEQHEEMARLYMDGKTTTEIGTVFGRHRGTIYDALKCRGVVMRDRSEAKRKYAVAHTAFLTVYDEETAYWLGFLFADGCVSSNPRTPTLTLSLKEADSGHLRAFLRFLDSNYPMPQSQRQRAVRTTIRSAQIVADLTGLGCTPRKTLHLSWPPIHEDLAIPFIRGYFDDDGSAYRGRGSPTLCFVGNLTFLNEIQACIAMGTGAPGRRYPHTTRWGQPISSPDMCTERWGR